MRAQRQLRCFVPGIAYRDLWTAISNALMRLEVHWNGLGVGRSTKYAVRATSVAVWMVLALQACASVPVSEARIPIRVMTYNIRSGNGNLDSTAAAIRAQSPDIVALQEVDVHWADRSGFADQVTELATKLGMQGRFAPIYVLPGLAPGAVSRQFGVAVLSRYPIVRFRNDTIARLSTQEPNPVPAPAPGLLDAVLDVNGQPVRVLNTHLDYRKDPAVRTLQVQQMLAFIGDLGVPTLVFGDMNASPSAPELQPLLQRLHDAWSGSDSPGLTYPADAPRERIDYVLVSAQFTVRSIRVPETQASDHRPVVAELILAGSSRGNQAPGASFSPRDARMTTERTAVDTLLSASTSGFDESAELVLRDATAFATAWRTAHNGVAGNEPPIVDFRSDMVVVLALGTHRTGGYSVRFDRMTTDGSGAIVHYTVTRPGPDCMTTQMITSPLQVVRVPRVEGTIRFERREVVERC